MNSGRRPSRPQAGFIDREFERGRDLWETGPARATDEQKAQAATFYRQVVERSKASA